MQTAKLWYDDVSVTAIPERELACFRGLPGNDETAELILVTNDHEDIVALGTGKVHCIPVAKFLLGLGSVQ